jgi:hypothetical protein
MESFDDSSSSLKADFLDQINLRSNSEFLYLKSELDSYYKNQKSPNTRQKSEIWHKNLYLNLNMLLTDIILTQNPIQQLKTLKKAYNWYESKAKNPKFFGENYNQNISSIKLPLLTVTPTPKKTFLDCEDVSKDLSHRNSIEELTKRFINIKKKQIESYKGFIQRKSSIKKWAHNKQRNHEDFLFKISTKIISKTPEPEAKLKKNLEFSTSVLYDFRSSPKRKGSLLDSGFVSSSPRRVQEIIQIDEIKKKLANKKIPVSSKCLENGISLYEDITYKKITPYMLPKGGERLLKSPKALNSLESSKKNKKSSKKPLKRTIKD